MHKSIQRLVNKYFHGYPSTRESLAVLVENIFYFIYRESVDTLPWRLYRLASTDNPGMSRVSGESVDTLPRGYYIGWHPRIVRGCPEYPGNLWILLCQGGII